MRRPALFLTIAFLAWPGSSLVAAEPSIGAFVGDWQGRVSGSDGVDKTAGSLHLQVRTEADGFHVFWQDLGERGQAAGDLDARFLPTARPGVFEYAPDRGSLLERMFASPATGNPLEGETLLWARLESSTLVVYSMKIDPEGGFDLDHYSWSRVDDGLHLVFNKRTEDDSAETTIEGELVAAGG